MSDKRRSVHAVRWPILKVLRRNPHLLKVRPALSLFFLKYMRKFRAQKVGPNIILHSHLPPLNSRAYSRLIREQLIERRDHPSHAQVGLTNACPQRCVYCYNRERKGAPMSTEEILAVVRDLKAMGVFWMGWTGGEPLLNKDIVRITEEAAEACAVKLFTTGCTLTPGLAGDLKSAGLFSVSVSLDHWREEVHDANRGFPGAFATALRAIETFRNVDGLHVGVSAVLSRDMIRQGQTEEFLAFLEGLGVHEAWLSEVKPSVQAFWNDDNVISEEDRLCLVRLQDLYNKRKGMTVNYLGHFEGREHFGCNAGHRMVYVDAFGEVSPCVFTPMTLGNVRERPLTEIVRDMMARFPSAGSCFINKNYKLFQARSQGLIPLPRDASLELLEHVKFGSPADFFKH
ncbi:MAG TPA: radical SAM protein [Candidatus Aminicenantes bacterium]|nr:radical SAM protein [Candidatus Aminicenantes bacterium]